MQALLPIILSPSAINGLRGELTRHNETISFADEPELAATVAALGMQREFGTINDEMSRFVFDATTGQPVAESAIRSELVQWRDWVGVRMWVEGTPSLELRVRGLQPFLHPNFSYRADGSLAQCVFFPELIAKILAAEGVAAVVVNRWGLNTIFGGFNPAQHYYQTNFWELENNDTLLFSRLIENRKIPFLGTHDLIAHLAGVRADAWERLPGRARVVREVLEDYFAAIRTPTITSLVLPYTAGVVLDDLAQPPNYDAAHEATVLHELTQAIANRAIDPAAPLKLLKFPTGFQHTIELARDARRGIDLAHARGQVASLVDELRSYSVAL